MASIRKEGEGPALIEVRTYFVRERNALLARALFSELYLDYYLHLMQSGVKEQSGDDVFVKDLLAAFTLHMASRPIPESPAWTLHFEEAGLDLFASGKNIEQRVIAHAMRDHVRSTRSNLFSTQIVSEREGLRSSQIHFEGSDVFSAVEEYYQQSEQRLARLFRLEDAEDIVLISAQPDCDVEWLSGLDDEKIRRLDQDETLSLLEQRSYRFECGCSGEVLAAVLSRMGRNQVEEIFQNDTEVVADCPRCGAKHIVARATLEKILAEQESS